MVKNNMKKDIKKKPLKKKVHIINQKLELEFLENQ